MTSIIKYRVSLGFVLVILMSGGVSVDAYAAGGCFSGPAKMSDGDVSAFTATPGSLLSSNPLGGLPMTSQVRALAGSSADSLDPLISLASQANGSQKTSIGAGLARAAKSCQAASPDYAQLIQQKVAAANDKDLTAAFLAGMSDIQTAALGGGAAGAGGGGGGGIAGGGSTGGSSGSNGAGGTSSTPSSVDSFSVGTRGTFARSANTTIQIIQ